MGSRSAVADPLLGRGVLCAVWSDQGRAETEEAGEHLFGETSNKMAMRLVDTRTAEGGVVVLTYERVRGE